MTSDNLRGTSARLDGAGNSRSGTRDQVTSSGETRSQLFQRLRSECVWDDSEQLKEQVRVACRNRGISKRAAGVEAWDAVADAFPIPDANIWNAFTSRSGRPPLISMAEDATGESVAIAQAWRTSMMLVASLATRCREIGERSGTLLQAISDRQGIEPVGSLIFDADAVSHMNVFLEGSPEVVVTHSQNLFSGYQLAGSAYSKAVAVELRNFNQVLELTQELIDKQWPRITAWLWGPRASEVGRFLARACEASSSKYDPVKNRRIHI